MDSHVADVRGILVKHPHSSEICSSGEMASYFVAADIPDFKDAAQSKTNLLQQGDDASPFDLVALRNNIKLKVSFST
jgi:hypothetical protein